MSATTCPNHPDRPSRIESAYGFCIECTAALYCRHRRTTYNEQDGTLYCEQCHSWVVAGSL